MTLLEAAKQALEALHNARSYDIGNLFGFDDEIIPLRQAIAEAEKQEPVSSIMAMSGHATPMSLSPYIKHTLRGATNAQQMRQYPQELMNGTRN